MNRKSKLKTSSFILLVFALSSLRISTTKDGKEGLFAFAGFVVFGLLSILCFYISSTIQTKKKLNDDWS